MVYWIARRMGKTVDYKTAERIAERFSFIELDRIYKAVPKGT
jgi:hypothetical protein